jgi:hypothetical protein
MTSERAVILCLTLGALGVPASLAAGCDRGAESAPRVKHRIEAEAEREISEQNYEQALGDLERELDASVPDAAADGGGADGGKVDGVAKTGAEPKAEPAPRGEPPKPGQGAPPKGGAAPKPPTTPYE